MTERCTFIRLLAEEEKDVALTIVIHSLRNGGEVPSLFTVNPSAFAMVPGSPFAYWLSSQIGQILADFPQFESADRKVRLGLITSDDFRFVRVWWEVDPIQIVTGTPETTPDEFKAQTFNGKRWVPFVKGGEYSPYYTDVHLVVNWKEDGQEMKSWVVENPNDPGTTHWSRNIRSTELYFIPGLTWPLRASHFSPQILPKGCIFSVRSYCAFTPENKLKATLTVFGSSTFDYLFKVMLGRFGYPEFLAGILQKMPWPDLHQKISEIEELSQKMWEYHVELHRFDECKHIFYCQILKKTGNKFPNEESDGDILKNIVQIQDQIDQTCFSIYNISTEDQASIVASSQDRPSPEKYMSIESSSSSENLMSYTLGCVYGRWDIRYATDEREPPELPDPFTPLPACSLGMLKGDDGLPLTEAPPGYPLAIDWDGILVDDESHGDDVVRRIRDVLQVIWGERASAIEQEACELLSVKSLRDYFRKPSKGGFWDDHVKRYSKSRRKAPIYWLLQSAKRNYALWIYYHRLDADTLFKALEHYVKPKVHREESRLQQMVAEKADLGVSGPAAKRLEAAIEKQEAFIAELMDFRDKLQRAADLFLTPDLDDGVVLTIAPLHELVPWSESKKYWSELLEGKYEWSSIGKQLRQKGLVK